ncbi:type II secretion system F family protein [Thermoanaerobacterium thermosaccharolyticum]|uniref:type II secretion system F family protein n=1 Tax=Thermoanaerobacterium thermosaccharolyticum TaxID=1517 RepID=UPI002FD8D460
MKNLIKKDTDEEKIIRSGIKMTVDDLAVYRFLCFVVSTAAFAVFLFTFNLYVIPLIFVFFIPDAVISMRAKERAKKMRKEFQIVASKLAVAVSGGLTFEKALEWSAQESKFYKSELRLELQRAIQKIRAGTPFDNVMKELASRTGLLDVQRLVVAIVQAQKYGTSISEVLKKEVSDARERMKADILGQASSAEKKMALALFVLAIPALILGVAPMIIQIVQEGGFGVFGGGGF